MKAVIMAGGHGTRIRSVASDIPKPMIPVLGKPVLQYQIENLKACGIEEIILVTGYLKESIIEYFGDGKDFGVHISYFNEDKPMGTAGALYYLKERLREDFLLLMGDLMLSVDFTRFMNAHRASDALATLFVHPNSHPFDSDIIVTDEIGRLEDYTEEVCGLHSGSWEAEKEPSATGTDKKGLKSLCCRLSRPVIGFISKRAERRDFYHNQVNSGIYAFSQRILDIIPEPADKKIDLDKDIVQPLISKGQVWAYASTEYVKDMGTPERYDEVTNAVKTGLAEKRNLKSRQSCIFMDRDGTINIQDGFINSPDRLKLIPGAADAVKRVNASRFLAVVITNQPVIARGEASFEELDEIHKCLDTRLGEKGAYIDGIYICPHHKDSGFEGEIKELKFKCRCRKPETGLIEKAAAEHNIDLKSSWLIGDSTMDIMCGRRAGLKTIGVMTGEALADGRYEAEPDFTAKDISEAIDIILNRG